MAQRFTLRDNPGVMATSAQSAPRFRLAQAGPLGQNPGQNPEGREPQPPIQQPQFPTPSGFDRFLQFGPALTSIGSALAGASGSPEAASSLRGVGGLFNIVRGAQNIGQGSPGPGALQLLTGIGSGAASFAPRSLTLADLGLGTPGSGFGSTTVNFGGNALGALGSLGFGALDIAQGRPAAGALQLGGGLLNGAATLFPGTTLSQLGLGSAPAAIGAGAAESIAAPTLSESLGATSLGELAGPASSFLGPLISFASGNEKAAGGQLFGGTLGAAAGFAIGGPPGAIIGSILGGAGGGLFSQGGKNDALRKFNERQRQIHFSNELQGKLVDAATNRPSDIATLSSPDIHSVIDKNAIALTDKQNWAEGTVFANQELMAKTEPVIFRDMLRGLDTLHARGETVSLPFEPAVGLGPMTDFAAWVSPAIRTALGDMHWQNGDTMKLLPGVPAPGQFTAAFDDVVNRAKAKDLAPFRYTGPALPPNQEELAQAWANENYYGFMNRTERQAAQQKINNAEPGTLAQGGREFLGPHIDQALQFARATLAKGQPLTPMSWDPHDQTTDINNDTGIGIMNPNSIAATIKPGWQGWIDPQSSFHGFGVSPLSYVPHAPGLLNIHD